MNKPKTKTARAVKKADREHGRAIALEANLSTWEVDAALRRHPHLYGNADVMALLIDIETNMSGSEDEHYEELKKVENDEYERGLTEGEAECVKTHLEPLFGAGVLVLDNWINGDLAAAVRELNEAIDDIRKAKVIA